MKKLLALFWIMAFLIASGCANPNQLSQENVPEKVVVVTEVVKVTATFPRATATEQLNPELTAEPTNTTPLPPTQTSRPTATQSTEIQLLVSAANLRSGPGTESDIIGIVESGEHSELLGKNADGSWLKVRTTDGRIGWIGSSVVQVNNDADLEIVAAEGVAISEPAQNEAPAAQAQDSALLPSPTVDPLTHAPPTETPITQPTAIPVAGETAYVVKVVDGDTIDVDIGGRVERLRYIGIDTPEYNEPCGTEATQANAALVAGKTVRLVRDITERDKYGRLLRYVYVGDLLVEAELVRQGWAAPYRYEPDTAQAAYLESLQAQAPVRNCGSSAPAADLPSGSNCDPAYPTVCIPSPPPDLDCGDVPHRRFQVLPPDPHNFDGNHDGEGCEG